jgi:hypothetical protein
VCVCVCVYPKPLLPLPLWRVRAAEGRVACACAAAGQSLDSLLGHRARLCRDGLGVLHRSWLGAGTPPQAAEMRTSEHADLRARGFG